MKVGDHVIEDHGDLALEAGAKNAFEDWCCTLPTHQPADCTTLA